jgi:putative membrane protein
MTRLAQTVATGLGTLGLLTPAWGQGGWDWGWHPMWGMWGAWGVGMLLVMLTFWVFAIIALVAGIRWLIGQGRQPGRDHALEILRERYARGEVSKEEFDAKKRDLS